MNGGHLTWPRAIQRARNGGRWWALGALGLSALAAGLDTTVLVTALPTLSAKLHASTSQLQWMMDAYTLVLSGLMLPARVLGDRLGRCRLLMGGLLLFGVSSAAASQTSSAAGLIGLRALMGAGAAAIVVLSMAILPSLFPDEERSRAVAVLAAAIYLSLPLGPLVAGWLLTRFAWGSIFLVNVPVAAVALAGVWLLVPESGDSRATRLDWPGALLAAAGVTVLIYGIIEQPANGWRGVPVATGLAGGAVLVTAFAVWQLQARSPVVDLRLLRSRRFSLPALAWAVAGFTLGGILFILTPFLQIVQGNDAQATGIRLLPLIAGIIASTLPSDRLTARLGTKALVAGGLLVTAVGAALLSRAGTDSGFAITGGAEAVIGLGIGMVMPPAMDAILGALPSEEPGAGIPLAWTLQFIAMSLGVAVLGSVLEATYRTGLASHLAGLAPQSRAATEGGPAGAAALAPHMFRAAQDAYAAGVASVMLVTAAVLAAAALLVTLFLPAGRRSREPLIGLPGWRHRGYPPIGARESFTVPSPATVLVPGSRTQGTFGRLPGPLCRPSDIRISNDAELVNSLSRATSIDDGDADAGGPEVPRRRRIAT